MNQQIKAKVILRSVAAHGIPLTTFQLQYHRYIHGEFMTHRVFSRNASSSRAIPVMTMIKQVWNDPAMPIHFGANMPGMQAKDELTGWRGKVARGLWRVAAKAACVVAYGMTKAGLHKQVANRILEPFQLMHVIVTATEWDNFFQLRDHEDAQPEIRQLAIVMKEAMVRAPLRTVSQNCWHLPYITDEEWIARGGADVFTLIKASAARCARVSYLTHDGKAPDIEKDVALYDRLVGSAPIHASPVEHQATPYVSSQDWGANFRGWGQHRQQVELAIES